MRGKLRIAVIGCGWAGERHVRALKELSSRGKIIALVDTDKTFLQEKAKKWGVSECYTDYRDVLSREDVEVDFVIMENLKVKELIQVMWDISDEKSLKREKKALLKAMEEFNLDKGLILTKDYSERKEVKSNEILYKPAWLWMLE